MIFFFKQKTAYEMRISDWSSDVCSSDLDEADVGELLVLGPVVHRVQHHDLERAEVRVARRRHAAHDPAVEGIGGDVEAVFEGAGLGRALGDQVRRGDDGALIALHSVFLCAHRSEEHTSELQSLMRISYAVFCLKKKK